MIIQARAINHSLARSQKLVLGSYEDEDFTHHIINARREDVVNKILDHIQTAFRIVDVQDCISKEEYMTMKQIKHQIEELFKES